RTRPQSLRAWRRSRTRRSSVNGRAKVWLNVRSCAAVRGQWSRAARTSRSRAVRSGWRAVLGMVWHRPYHARRPFLLHMSADKKPFVNVDELMPRLSVEQVAVYYGVELPELR